jgi:hypothetical protein
MQQANVPIRPQFPRWNVVLRRPGQNSSVAGLRFAPNCCGCAAGRAQPPCGHGIKVRQEDADAANFSAVCRRRHTGDAGDSAARSIRHRRPCLLDHAIELHHYVTDQTIMSAIMLDQPVPFSHAHHVGGFGLDCRYCHAGVEKSTVAGISSDPHLHDVPLAARARGLPDESGPGERASAPHRRRGACSESHSCCADVCRLSARRLY